jgi:hypothetical protein
MKKFTDKINESVEDTIPTAVEFLHNYPGEPDDDTIFKAMIDFAKLHVEAALKAASVSAEIENCGNPYDPSDDSKCVSETSILNAYPLDNIK